MRSQSTYSVFLGGISAQLLTIGIARFAYTPLLPIMQDQAGLNDQMAGLLGGAIYAGYLSGTLALIAIKSPRHRLMIFRFCLLLGVFSTLAMGLRETIWIWAISRFLGGLSGVAGMLLAAEFILGWLQRNNLRPDLGPHFMGLGLGISLAGLVSLILGAGRDWAMQWLVFSILAAFLLPLAWGLTPKPANPGAKTQAHPPTPADRNSDIRWFWIFGIGYFAAGWGYSIGATFCVDILTSGGETHRAASLVWLVLGLSNAVGALLGSVASRRFGIMPVLLTCMICQSVALLAFGLQDSVIFNYLAAVLFGATFVVIVSLSLTLAGLKMQQAGATGMARMTLLYGCGQIIAPVATAHLVVWSGSYMPALALGAAILAGGAVFMGYART